MSIAKQPFRDTTQTSYPKLFPYIEPQSALGELSHLARDNTRTFRPHLLIFHVQVLDSAVPTSALKILQNVGKIRGIMTS